MEPKPTNIVVEKKRVRRLLRDLARDYRVPQIRVKYQDDYTMAECHGSTEQDGQTYLIRLNSLTPEIWFQTAIHEAAHVVHMEMEKAFLTTDKEHHGSMFFNVYRELYQKYLES